MNPESISVIYIANIPLPTTKAHGINILETVRALAHNGGKIFLVYPVVRGKEQTALDLPPSITITSISRPDFLSLFGRWGFWMNEFYFAFFLLFQKLPQTSAVLTRDPLITWLLSLRGYRTFFDMHGIPRRLILFWQIAARRFTGILITNEWKRKCCVEVLHMKTEQVLTAPNGYNQKHFEHPVSRNDARRLLNIGDGGIILYSGHLYDWKGAGVLVEAARMMPENKVILVGGSAKEIEDFKNKNHPPQNTLFIEQVPHSEIPNYLRAADVLVLPNSEKTASSRLKDYSRFETSPIKLFEYMASGTPIVASDLPSIREIVSDREVLFVRTDDPDALKEGIRSILEHADESSQRSNCAKERAKHFTWDERAKHIIEFISL